MTGFVLLCVWAQSQGSWKGVHGGQYLVCLALAILWFQDDLKKNLF
jgi:hypothetical protein